MQRTRGELLRGALAQIAEMEQMLIAAGVQLPQPPAQVLAGPVGGLQQVQVQAGAENVQGIAPVVGALQVQVAGIRRVRDPVTGRRRRVQVIRQPAPIVEQAIFLPPVVGQLPIVVPHAVVLHSEVDKLPHQIS